MSQILFFLEVLYGKYMARGTLKVSPDHVKDSTGGSRNDVLAIVQLANVLAKIGTTNTCMTLKKQASKHTFINLLRWFSTFYFLMLLKDKNTITRLS